MRQAFLCLDCQSLKIAKDKEGSETDSLTDSQLEALFCKTG